MAQVVFHQKPGCGTNARQKARLEAAGHRVEVRNLLTEPWSAQRLRGFFGDTPVRSWFNAAAPRVKSGEIDPGGVNEAEALALMLADPLLIRRPLVEVGDMRCAGFDREPVLSLLAAQAAAENLEGCSRQQAGPCPTPDKDHPSDLETTRLYHQRVKHRFESYAAGPETLDWDMQPDPFRAFLGAARVELDVAQAGIGPSFSAACAPGGASPQKISRSAIGAFLHLAMGLSAWKQYAGDAWALRCNPSSGNLHPTEAYVFSQGVDDLDDGLYHYVSRDHILELRCAANQSKAAPTRLWVGLSSIYWREAWKYGERAFRYCQLDTGHALAALRYAAGVMGWRAQLVENVSTDVLAQRMGLDRAEDFVGVEREDAEALIEIFYDSQSVRSAAPPETMAGLWTGRANLLDRHPLYRWPIIEEASLATRGRAPSEQPIRRETPQLSPTSLHAAKIILNRRSAQRFDDKARMNADLFFALLNGLQPSQSAPWDVWTYRARLHPIIFVHSVEGVEPGLYVLPRTNQAYSLLRGAMNQDFDWAPVVGAPADLGLARLKAGDYRRVAQRLFCGQAIAADACFALGLLAEFDDLVTQNPWRYRQLHWEAGLIGQALYLTAEAADLRGTGIGCFFDDPLHALLGLENARLQMLYCFTVGRPLVDDRILTLPAYSNRSAARLREKTP